MRRKNTTFEPKRRYIDTYTGKTTVENSWNAPNDFVECDALPSHLFHTLDIAIAYEKQDNESTEHIDIN
ncbi:hypothetical protein ACF0H5_010146 [Mactra antiquata]